VNITCNGAIFSIDALLAFIILLFALLSFSITLTNYSQSILFSSRQFYLEEKTILAADSFVKNYSSQNGLLGAAILDFDKKRIRANELSTLNFESFNNYNSENFFVSKIYSANETIYDSGLQSESCFSVKRFVLLDSQKKIITYQGCLIE
jgi:hypothetical protein